MSRSTTIVLSGLLAAMTVLAAWSPQARASAPASDNDCNSAYTNGVWANGENGGSGFNAWSETPAIAGGGGFYNSGNSATAAGHISPGINCSSSVSWGMYSGGAGSGNSAHAARTFTAGGTPGAALQVGQIFSIDMANGSVSNSGIVGFSLQNSSGQDVFSWKFIGGSTDYSTNNTTSAINVAQTSFGWTNSGFQVQFSLTVQSGATTQYTAKVFVPGNAGGPSFVYTSQNEIPESGGQLITQVLLFNTGGGAGTPCDLFFNNLSITCPDTLTFTEQPASESVPTNDVAIFTVANLGDSVTYQWQSSANSGASWSNISGATNSYSITATDDESSLPVAATPANAGFEYRCIATDACGNAATSSVATLTLAAVTAPGITTQPANTAVCSNSPATFTVTASGASPGYTWLQQSNAGWGSGNSWSVTASNAGGGVYLGSSTNNDATAGFCTGFGNDDINSPNTTNAFGIYGPAIKIGRSFPSALSAGQWFSVDMDNGDVDIGVQNGFSLDGGGSASNTVLLSFYFLGGQKNYKISDRSGEHDTGIAFTREGLRVQVLVGSAVGGTNTYSLFASTNQCSAGSNITNVFSGLFNTNGLPGAVLLYNNNNAGGPTNDLFFNNIIAGAAFDDADNYSVRNWANGGNGGNLPISGATSNSYTISNAQSNNVAYYAIVTDPAGVEVSSNATLTVNSLPAPYGVGGGGAYCSGGNGVSVTLSNSDVGITYYLQLGGTNSVASLPGTGTGVLTFGGVTGGGSYQILGSNSATGCLQPMSGSATVTVNPLPTVSVNSATICSGVSTTLTATSSAAGPSYLWSPGGATAASITVSPASTTIYTVTVTDASTGCSNSGSGTVTVNPPPTVSVNSATICSGVSTTLTATSSAASPGYLWSPGGATAASITVSPASTTIYTVTVTDASTGCSNSGSGTVTVNPLPTATVTDSTNIVTGGSATIQAALTGTAPWIVAWSDGVTNTTSSSSATRTVTPASTTVYTVTAVSDANCTDTSSGSATVTVSAPTVPLVITAITQQGGNITITWTGNGGTTNEVQFTPGTGNGNYATNNFTDIPLSLTVLPGTGAVNTNYVDVGGGTNTPSRFYRVRLVQ